MEHTSNIFHMFGGAFDFSRRAIGIVMFGCSATHRMLSYYFFDSEHNPSQHPALLGLRGVKPSGQTKI